MIVKDKIHKIIDDIEDEYILNAYLSLLSKLSSRESGELYNSLTDEQKAELNLSYDESFIESNLLAHEDVKKEHAKWLLK